MLADGETTTDATSCRTSTVTVSDLVSVSMTMRAVPGATAVTRPDPSTETTFASIVRHVSPGTVTGTPRELSTVN
jgi:hypothetical protein